MQEKETREVRAQFHHLLHFHLRRLKEHRLHRDWKSEVRMYLSPLTFAQALMKQAGWMRAVAACFSGMTWAFARAAGKLPAT